MTAFSATERYKKIILDQANIVLLIIGLIVVFFGFHATKFRLDASADSLVLENDAALKYYRTVKANFGSEDILILTYTPNQPLFSQPVLDDLTVFGNELKKLDNVASVMTIMTVPLIESPLVTLGELSEGIRTLSDPDTDRALARTELLTGPIYKDLITSADGKTTALLVTVSRDEVYHQLVSERNALKAKALEAPLDEFQLSELARVSEQFTHRSIQLADNEKQLVANIRQLVNTHRGMAQMHLGGVTMITADSIEFVRHDLTTFSIGIVVFIILLLVMAFRRTRWVILPIVTCAATGVVMLGFLGLMDWPVTVVSSNFLSLMLIITLSLTIHLIVRYRELQVESPQLDASALILETVRLKFIPCFYTAFTTIVAFSSLIISEIRPIIDFGWMMSIGVTVAFILSFTLFPAMLMLLNPPESVAQGSLAETMGHYLSVKVERFHLLFLLVFVGLTAVSGWGITKLSVENRFIDYYKDTTEIYQGMALIDSQLGGTTPLDVVIDAPKSFFEEEVAAADYEDYTADEGEDEHPAYDEDEDEEDEDIFSEELLGEEDEGDITSTSYWFNTTQLKELAKIHYYLDGLPETGKVLSLENSMSMLRKINEQVADDSFLLAILYKSLPQDIKSGLFSPYMTADGNKLRFSIRLFESDRSLKRQELVSKIRDHLVNELGLESEQVHLSGMAVLYNNMLQSLFKSQILTIGVVFFAILLMFMVLFRSFKIALIALIPNIIAASFILGLMGGIGIPLDLMTITIAAISIGIAVDNSIHYTHRFIDEYSVRKDYWASVRACHCSIGQAMYFTSITITLGFGLLAMSNFIPTIYFGLLTGFAMLMALFANLTLLPVLLVRFKAVS
ncbi:MAG: putative RND superfamily exporter protein [Phenylobacterium sp.]